VNWEGNELVAMLLAYGGGPPLPTFNFYFPTTDLLVYGGSDGEIEYRRDATIDTYPTIPWGEDDGEPCKSTSSSTTQATTARTFLTLTALIVRLLNST
jgi:hypothetical protein